jgi:hypothetical protein
MMLGCGGFFGLLWYNDIQASKNMNKNRPPFAAPPGPGQPPVQP